MSDDAPVELSRCVWIMHLMDMDRRSARKEVMQMMVDLMDIFEQSEDEQPCIVAHDLWQIIQEKEGDTI